MSAAVRNPDNSKQKPEPGRRRKTKQTAPAGKKKKKRATGKKKSTAAGSSTPVRDGNRKTPGRKKVSSRKKSTARGKPRKRAATEKEQLASIPVDPPPVILPDAAAAADDPKSLSWMAQQAVSALNAVKANQAEKGKIIMARAEKDKREPAADVSAAATGMPEEYLLMDEPGEAPDLQAPGEPDRKDSDVQPAAAPEPAEPQPVDLPPPAVKPGQSAVEPVARRRYSLRLQALAVVAIAIMLWLYLGGDEATEPVTLQAEQETGDQPAPELSAPAIPEPVATPAPAMPEPVATPAPAMPEPSATPVQAMPEPVAAPAPTIPEAVATPAMPEPSATPTQAMPEPAPAGAVPGTLARETGRTNEPSQPAGHAPAPVQPPHGYRRPGYGYYPQQRSWQQPRYQTGYARPQPPR